MEKSDFDLFLLELTKECSYAILGGLSFNWNCVSTMMKSRDKDAEWVQAQLLFVFKDYFDKIAKE